MPYRIKKSFLPPYSIKYFQRYWFTLNLYFLKSPEDIIDYMILDELCHLKIKEHSHHYWDLIMTLMHLITLYVDYFVWCLSC